MRVVHTGYHEPSTARRMLSRSSHTPNISARRSAISAPSSYHTRFPTHLGPAAATTPLIPLPAEPSPTSSFVDFGREELTIELYYVVNIRY